MELLKLILAATISAAGGFLVVTILEMLLAALADYTMPPWLYFLSAAIFTIIIFNKADKGTWS